MTTEHPNLSEMPRMPEEYELTATLFRTKYRSQMCVVFPRLLSSWPACQRWAQRSHLEAALGGPQASVRVQTSPNNRVFNAVYHRSADTDVVTVASMLNATLYAQNGRVGAVPTGATQDVARRLYCKLSLSATLTADMGALPKGVFGEPKGLGPAVAGETTFWVGSAGVVTPLHFDHCHTVIAQIVGRKRVIVSPLSDSEHLYPFSVADGAARTSRVDLHAWMAGDRMQREAFPDVAHARLLQCVIEPGDVVYIPPGWYVRASSGPRVGGRRVTGGRWRAVRGGRPCDQWCAVVMATG